MTSTITTPSHARSGEPVLPARGLEGGGRGERDHAAGERHLPRLPRQQARRENGGKIHIFILCIEDLKVAQEFC